MRTKLGTYEYITDQARVPGIVEELRDQPYISVDTETTGLDIFTLDTLLFQVAFGKKAYLIDTKKVDITPFKEILEGDDWLKVLQNAKYDYKVLYSKHGISVRNIFDTMVAERLLHAGLKKYPANLEHLADVYAGVRLNKQIRKDFEEFTGDFKEEQLAYAADDVLVLQTIMKAQRNELKRCNMLKIAHLEFALIESVGTMELVGFKLDANKWRKTLKEVNKKLFSIRYDIREALPTPEPPPVKPLRIKKDGTPYKKDLERVEKPDPVLNVDSWQQMLVACSQYGINLELVNKKTRAGKTNSITLKAATSRYADSEKKVKLLQAWLLYKGYKQVEKTFGEGLISWIAEDGRIHAEFNQNGTHSGRFSSSNPNLQNIQKKREEGKILRSCFIPEVGNKFIIADYSQIELRIAAQCSNDPTMLAILNSPEGDVHKGTASEMFKVPYDEVTSEQRDAAKTLNFGIIYGMSAGTLAIRLKCDKFEAEKSMAKYRLAYGTLLEWIEAEGISAFKREFSDTLGGRRRWFPTLDPKSENYRGQKGFYERVGRNHPIQGTSADMTKTSMVLLLEPLRRFEAYIVNCVHDELCIETSASNAVEVSNIVSKKMIQAGKKFLTKVPVLVDVKIRNKWWKDDETDDLDLDFSEEEEEILV